MIYNQSNWNFQKYKLWTIILLAWLTTCIAEHCWFKTVWKVWPPCRQKNCIGLIIYLMFSSPNLPLFSMLMFGTEPWNDTGLGYRALSGDWIIKTMEMEMVMENVCKYVYLYYLTFPLSMLKIWNMQLHTILLGGPKSNFAERLIKALCDHVYIRLYWCISSTVYSPSPITMFWGRNKKELLSQQQEH